MNGPGPDEDFVFFTFFISMNGIQYDQLNKFVGRWDTKGKLVSRDNNPETQISGTDTYEWLPGEFFLLHKADVLIGKDRSQTFEIIGFDSEKKVYTMQHYNNKGESGFMTATCTDENWKFQGEGLRFTGGFKNNDKEFSGTWEQSGDGKTWTEFIYIRLTRSK